VEISTSEQPQIGATRRKSARCGEKRVSRNSRRADINARFELVVNSDVTLERRDSLRMTDG